MRSIAAILVSLLSLAPLYNTFSVPISHDNVSHHAVGATNNENCDPAHYKNRHVDSGINCAEMNSVKFQPAHTNGLICMTNEQARHTQSPGIFWMAKHFHPGANRHAAFPGDEGHFRVNLVKGHRDYRRASVVQTPVSTRPLPPIPASAYNARPITLLRPLPKIPGQAPAADAPVKRPRPLPATPGSRIKGPRPNPKIRRY